MRDLTYAEFLGRAEALQGPPDGLAKALKELYSSDGPLVAVAAALQDAKVGYTAAAMNQNLLNEESVRTAVGIRGQVAGLDSALQIIYGLMVENTDAPDTGPDTGSGNDRIDSWFPGA